MCASTPYLPGLPNNLVKVCKGEHSDVVQIIVYLFFISNCLRPVLSYIVQSSAMLLVSSKMCLKVCLWSPYSFPFFFSCLLRFPSFLSKWCDDVWWRVILFLSRCFWRIAKFFLGLGKCPNTSSLEVCLGHVYNSNLLRINIPTVNILWTQYPRFRLWPKVLHNQNTYRIICPVMPVGMSQFFTKSVLHGAAPKISHVMPCPHCTKQNVLSRLHPGLLIQKR